MLAFPFALYLTVQSNSGIFQCAMLAHIPRPGQVFVEDLAKPEDNDPHASDDKSIRGVRQLRYQSASDEKIYTTERPKARSLQ
jgi:hypothetical protein